LSFVVVQGLVGWLPWQNSTLYISINRGNPAFTLFLFIKIARIYAMEQAHDRRNLLVLATGDGF